MKKIFFLFMAVVCCTISLSQRNSSLDLASYCTRITLFDQVEISLYTPSMFRFRISNLKENKFDPKYSIPFVIGKLENWDKVNYSHFNDENFEYIKTNVLLIKISKNGFNWSVWTADGTSRISPSDGPIYGMFRDGYTVFDNASAFNEMNVNSRYSHWFYNPSTGNYNDTFLEEDLIEDKYFIYGPSYENLFRQFNELTGPEPLLPKKAYGFFQTQHLACAGNQTKLLEMAKQFRDRDIPCDNIIIDFEWGDGCDRDQEVKWGSRLDWSSNYTNPLSPEAMIDSLHRMHFNVMLIHHSAPDFKNRVNQGWTETLYEENLWWRKFKEKLDIGIDGTWQDTRRNDITDAVIWKGIQDSIGSEKRVLFMGCRKMQAINPWDNYFTAIPMNQLIGSRRYPFDWTGDCSYSWNEFKWQIKAITDTHGSMKGVSYISSDAVGANWKIQARWNQFGDFSSISRSHNPKPWSGDIDVQDFVNKIQITGRDTLISNNETANINQLDRPTAENSIRKHRKLRYRLLPYIYSFAHINYQTGMPICRPMLLTFPNDHRCNGDQWPYQYMFGEALLVAPVYGDFTTMEIYLPAGYNWIDYWNHEIYKGGGILRYDVTDIEKLPIFIKSGSIIPMREEMNWIDPNQPNDPVLLDIYPGENSSFSLYEDDGKTTRYQNGEFSKIVFSYNEKNKQNITLHIGQSEGTYKGIPKQRTYILSINLIYSAPKTITMDSSIISLISDKDFLSESQQGWFYDSTKKTIYIKTLVDTRKESTITITREDD